MSELDKVMTAAEAARLWGKDPSTIKKRCQEGRWHPGEYRRAGKEWLILRSALVREYGEPKNSDPKNISKISD
ncbi:MAG: helix-turn-helix domain-containing protein [Bacilli bacterium]